MTMTPTMIIIIVAACIFAVASLLYGVFRKFTQMGWGAWQILFAWCITMTLDWLPIDINARDRVVLSLLVFAIAVLGTLALGGAIRLAMNKKRLPAHPAWRFIDRLLGMLTALLDYVMIVTVLGTVALTFCAYGITPPAALSPFFATGFWTNFLGKFGLDLLLVTVFFFALRGGWRVGFARTLVIFLMMALTFGVLALSIFLAVFWAPMSAFAQLIGRSIAGIDLVTGMAIGYLIVVVLLFIVFFLIVCLLGYFIVKLIRHIRFHYFWGFLDGILGLAISLVIVTFLTLFFYAIAGKISDPAFFQSIVDGLMDAQFGDVANQLSSIFESVVGAMAGVRSWLESAPVSWAFFMLYA